MDPKTILGGTIGAVIGAVIWGGLIYLIHTEFSMVAILIGIIVGLGGKLAGEEGIAEGVICAILALCSILGGKAIGGYWALPGLIATELQSESHVSQGQFAEYLQDAEAFKDVEEEDFARYMVERRYSGAPDETAVTEAEIDWFKAEVVPMLEELGQENRPSYEVWREAEIAKMVAQVQNEVSVYDYVIANMGFLDIIFILVGMYAAFQMAMGGVES